MIDHIARAIPHGEHTGRDHQGGGQTLEVDEGHTEKADLWENHHQEEQGVANSHVAVISHGIQHENLSHNKHESIPPGYTPMVFFVTNKLTQFQGQGHRITKVDDSQIPEENVHGDLKLRVSTGEGEDAHASC